MKKNYYLLGAMLLSASLINAQAPQTILKYGFENGETFGIDGKGYIEFTDFSDEWAASGGILNLEYSDGYEGQCLQINSEGCGAAAQYQRSMKMRNLQKFEENTSYRLSYRVKAPENAIIRCMLMRGGNRGNDMPFVAESSDENSAYATYTYNVTGFNNSDWQYKSSMFYYSTDDKQKEFFHTHKPDFVAEELIDSSFVSINMFSEGEQLLDDVEIIPSNIAVAGYNGCNVRLDLGYETNYA